MFEVDDKVIIVKDNPNTSLRGKVGIVRDIIDIGHDLWDLDISLEGEDIGVRVPSESCRFLSDKNGYLARFAGIDNYLSYKEMKDILMKVFEKEAEKCFEHMIHNRQMAGWGSITDQVLFKIAEKYCKERFDELSPTVMDRFKSIITRKPETEEEHSFESHLIFRLSECADKYIKEHQSEIENEMKERIYEKAELMSDKIYVEKLNTHIQKSFESFINSLLESNK